MEAIEFTQKTVIQEASMAGLVNHTPELLARKGWDAKTFAAYCMLKGIGQDTAYRLARGETNFNVQTLASVAEVLGVDSIGKIIDLPKPSGE